MIPYGPITVLPLGPLTLSTWGLMVSLGFLVGILFFWKYGKKRYHLTESALGDLALLTMVGGIVGGRLLFVWENWAYYQGNIAEIFKLWHGGMVFYGGFVLALLLVWGYIRIKKISFWVVADALTVGLPLGVAIGRVGCHLIRDHPGELTGGWWAQNYYGEMRHETALYEIIANLVFVLGYWLWLRRKEMFPGTLFLLYAGWYAVTRFLIEFYRASDLPNSDPRWFEGVIGKGLTISQVVSLVGIVMIAVLLLRKRKLAKMRASSIDV